MTDTTKTAISSRGPLRVFIAADGDEACDNIVRMLSSAADIHVASYTSNVEEIETALQRLDGISVLITDVLVGGRDMAPVITRIKQRLPHLDVLVYSAYSQEPFVIRAILAGATGYILRNGQEDLVTGVRLLRGGGSPVSPLVARSVLSAIHSRTLATPAPTPQKIRVETPEGNQLSQREMEILTLLAKGISFAEIGALLSISPHTVTAHIKKIYRKLQVHSRGEAVYEASCLGLI